MAVAVALAFLASCDTEETVAPDTVEASDRVEGRIDLTTQTVVAVRNPVGPVIVAGETLDPVVRWYMNRVVTGPAPDEARARLADITLSQRLSADSLGVAVTSPAAAAPYAYSSLLSLGVPYEVSCVVEEAVGDVEVSYLFGSVEVRSGSSLTMRAHNGSCDVRLESGPLTLQVAPPDDGRCWAVTGSGDVSLTIPALTNATVTLRATGGTISLSGLTLTNSVEGPGTLTGLLGAGGADIRLETKGGSIVLKGM